MKCSIYIWIGQTGGMGRQEPHEIQQGQMQGLAPGEEGTLAAILGAAWLGSPGGLRRSKLSMSPGSKGGTARPGLCGQEHSEWIKRNDCPSVSPSTS